MEKNIASFIDKIQYIEDFIHLYYGDHNILYVMRKDCNQKMKFIDKLLIKSFIVHGMGCLFSFKDSQVDISLLNDRVCFNAWSLSGFLNFRYNKIQIEKRINDLINRNVISPYINNYYILNKNYLI